MIDFSIIYLVFFMKKKNLIYVILILKIDHFDGLQVSSLDTFRH